MFNSNKPISNNNTPSPLLSLPKETRQEEIFFHSPINTLGFLARTSKQFKEDTAFLRLLAASIHAAPEFMDAKQDATALASTAILKNELKEHPELLFRKKMVIDHHGRKIEASPYQIFLGAGDIWAWRQINEEILPLIKNGEAQVEAQFKEQFPNCPWPLPENIREEMFYDDRNRKQIEAIVKQLAVVQRCISADVSNNRQSSDETKEAVVMLCKLFQPEPGEVIRSGLHFPLGIMNEIYKTYNALTDHWSYFTLAVIKPAQDALSNVDKQSCRGGLQNLDMEKGPNRRCDSAYKHSVDQPLALILVDDKEKRGVAVFVDPYDGVVLFDSTSYPGNFHAYNKNGCVRFAVVVAAGMACFSRDTLMRLWATYGEQKRQLMGAVMRSCFDASTHCLDDQGYSIRCVIL